MKRPSQNLPDTDLAPHFPYWEKSKDIVDQLLDIMLNYRQSGHPGGSRSKAHLLLALLLGGAMRWDIRRPEKRFADRFVLAAGHTVPLVYCVLAFLNEALRIKHARTGDARYRIPESAQPLFWQDLLGFRRIGGLSGHAEMAGKSLFLKFNTGPTGHGTPAAAGIALALKRAGAGGVRVFALEGETGLTAGGAYETMNSAWGLALDNLFLLLDWNDFGIDDHPVSSAVYGKPAQWFEVHGWRVCGTVDGSDWAGVSQTLADLVGGDNADRLPNFGWFRTRKGRGYFKYDNASHGTPHPINSTAFWDTKRSFANLYGVQFANFDGPAPDDPEMLRAEFRANLEAVIEVLHRDECLVDYLADRLVELGERVPLEMPTLVVGAKRNPFEDARLVDYRSYPAELYVAPGTAAANRAALGKWGAWVNALGMQEYGQPLFLACSADLAGSTNISGFAGSFGDFQGCGWYERFGTANGALLPQEITEFANSGILAGLVTVNLAPDPAKDFWGFWGASSTYGSFSYLKYGPLRLFSQLAQDTSYRIGKVLWIVGHSGPETADDSRTHFGIFAPGVTQLFPKGHVINLHPWEHNEVPVLLGAALALDVPIVALHLTRPAVPIPDREALGMPSHFEAARGAYIVRDYAAGQARGGTLVVQGTSTMAGIVKLLPELDRRGLNVKIVCATSPELYASQDEMYRKGVLSEADRIDSTVVTTQARQLMRDWLFSPQAEAYAISADWDNQWRTGGALEEVLEEAHLSADWLLAGIERFVSERDRRLGSIGAALAEARGG